MQIENFKTSIKVDPNLITINLDPKENVQNKKNIRTLLKNIVESSLSSL